MVERRADVTGRRLHDDDIAAIAEQLSKIKIEIHACRFAASEPQELIDTIRFVRNFNHAMEESKSVVRKTLLVALIGLFISVLSYGSASHLKKLLGP
jgi:hypothetical protein